VRVDERVGQLLVRRNGQPVERVGSRDGAGGDGVEQGAYAVAVHGPERTAPPGYPPVVLLDNDTLELVALAAGGVAVLSLGVGLSLILRISKLQAAYDALVAGQPGATFADAIGRQSTGIEGLRADVRVMRDDLAAARADLSDALRHVAVVRYDAFGDMGGRMSFSAALLDDAGDGLVITSINGRSETRTYAKGVKAGSSEHSLSPEEEQAIGYATRAVEGDSDADLTGATRRSRR
jgi:HAMP domain-containing protein